MKRESFIALSVIVVALLYYCSPKDKPATNQDITCRAIVRDGLDAKTQAERDYAVKRFGENCNGWTDPNDPRYKK